MSTAFVAPPTAAPPLTPPRRTERELLEAIAQRLDRIEGRLAALDPIIRVADEIPSLVAMATDVVDEQIAGMQARGVDVEERLRGVGRLLGRLSEPDTVMHMERLLDLLPRLEPLLDSGVVAPETVAVIAKLGEALTSTLSEPVGEAGLFRAWRATRTTEVRRAVDFMLRLAGRFGATLDPAAVLERDREPAALERPSPRALPAPERGDRR